MAATTDTEMLYPGESADSEFFKCVRIARHLKDMRIGEPRAHIAVVGLLSSKILMQSTEEMERDRGVIKDMLWRARGGLSQCGLGGPDDLRVYVPYKCAPIERPGQVVLFALPTAPRPPAPYMWDRQPRIQVPVHPGVEASLNMVYDLKARQEEDKHKQRAERFVDCQVEVWIVRPGSTIRERFQTPGVKVTLTVGPNGIEEFGTELTALGVRLGTLGSIANVHVALKGEGTFSFEKSTADRLIKQWQSKAMLSLSATIGIPLTKLKLPIEIKAYIDNDRKPGIAVQFQVFQFP